MVRSLSKCGSHNIDGPLALTCSSLNQGSGVGTCHMLRGGTSVGLEVGVVLVILELCVHMCMYPPPLPTPLQSIKVVYLQALKKN